MRNFYQHQERAFAKTAKLILLLAVALIGTVAITSLAITYTVLLVYYCMHELNPMLPALPWQPVFALCCLVAGLYIGVSSWWKIRQLSGGGKALAEDLGGEPIERATASPEEQRALNVVEEMAISAGIPVPAVYVLRQEPGINAFAAGLDLNDAVIGLTRGCVVHLERDQLQGVVAHEFSHIFNGDMRLNLRLVGVLYGVLSITILAEHLLQAAHEILHTPARRGDQGGDVGSAFLLALLGVLLWPIGLIGMGFGLLVMSATSRQREFLADAYAVQFTRYPDGIADALKVLAGLEAGSRVRSPKSLEASHFFFASGSRLGGLLATHPPLAERIRRLDAAWDGVPIFVETGAGKVYEGVYGHALSLLTGKTAAGERNVSPTLPAAAPVSPSAQGTETGTNADDVASDREREARIFETTSDWTRRHRSQLTCELPGVWLELLAEPTGCDALLVTLWFVLTETGNDSPDSAQSTPLQLSPGVLPDSLASVVSELIEPLANMDEAHQTLLYDLATERLAELRGAALPGVHTYLPTILRNAAEDTLRRWSWTQQFRRALNLHSRQTVRAKYGKASQIQGASEIILSRLCHAGSESDAMAQYAFQRAVVHLELADPQYWHTDQLDLERFEVAVEEVRQAAPHVRHRLLIALGCCVAADQGVTVEEAELVRGLCAALGWANPLLLPGQAVAPGA